MEASGPSGNSSHSSQLKWAEAIGTVMAILTLTIPLWITSYYSSQPTPEVTPRTTTYSSPPLRN